MDQSGSMAESVVYGAVTGAIFASIPALETHVVVFDTEVVDLTEQCGDPVDMLFGVQLGGGTDINRAVAVLRAVHPRPAKDALHPHHRPLSRAATRPSSCAAWRRWRESGVRCVTLLALSDSGVPCYDEQPGEAAAQPRASPASAAPPSVLPDLLAGALKGRDLEQLAASLAPKAAL